MKIRLALLLPILALPATGGLRAANYAWNQPADRQAFENPANWLANGTPAAAGPGAFDDVLTPLTVINPETGDPDVGSMVWLTGENHLHHLTLNLTLGWGLTASNSAASLTIHGDVTKSGSPAMYFGNSAPQDIGITTPSALAVHVLGNFTSTAGAFQIGNTNRGIGSFIVEGLTTLQTGTLSFRGPDVQLRGGLNVAGGQVLAYFGSGSGGFSTSFLTGAGTIRPSSSIGAVATVTLHGATGTSDFAGLLADQNSTLDPSTLAILKTGGGTQKFSRAAGSTFTGGTVIEGGAILVNNATGSGLGYGAVDVKAGGTLGGTGLIALQGANGVTLRAGGLLAPGDDGLGTLRLNGLNTTGAILSVESGSRIVFDLGASNASDRLQFLNYAGASDFLRAGPVTLDFASAQPGTFTLFEAFANAGTTPADFGFDASAFTLGSGLAGYGAAWDFSTPGRIGLVVSAVPEPSTFFLLGAAGLLSIRRRRPPIS